MVRVDTLGIVAGVQDAFPRRNRSLIDRERYAMSCGHLFSNTESTVSHAGFVTRSLPLPARCWISRRKLALETSDVFTAETHVKTLTQDEAEID